MKFKLSIIMGIVLICLGIGSILFGISEIKDSGKLLWNGSGQYNTVNQNEWAAIGFILLILGSALIFLKEVERRNECSTNK